MQSVKLNSPYTDLILTFNTEFLYEKIMKEQLPYFKVRED